MFPLYLAMIVLVPISVMAFLLNSCIQSLRSNRRIRLHEKGLMGIQTDMYRVPLLINGMREVVEDVYENLNNAQSHEYLGEEPEPEMSVKEPAPLLPVKAPVVEEPVTVESVKSVSVSKRKIGVPRKFNLHVTNANLHGHANYVFPIGQARRQRHSYPRTGTLPIPHDRSS